RTLLSNALQSGSENIFQLLLEKYGVETVIRSNSEEDSSTSLRAPKEVMQDVVLDLLEANDGYGKIDIYGVDDDSPLLWAAKHRKEGVLRLLLDIQWTDSIDVNPRDGDGRTPLSYAAASGEIGIMRALLESKEMEVDVNSKDNSGFTPLHWASQNGETDILELLLRHPKTDVNARNNKGRTALSLAAENGRTKTIKALLKEEDIDIVSKDDSGSTTKDWALKSGDFSIIGLL
ncbi:ankyrin, partial [Ascobolus immersus RN42]